MAVLQMVMVLRVSEWRWMWDCCFTHKRVITCITHSTLRTTTKHFSFDFKENYMLGNGDLFTIKV